MPFGDSFPGYCKNIRQFLRETSFNKNLQLGIRFSFLHKKNMPIFHMNLKPMWN